MPVRSLGSSVLRWPDRETVDRAVRAWAAERASDPNVRRIGYFGSYADGRWGVGSDVDLVVLVSETREAFERRALEFNALALPVPADVFVYTTEEWDRMRVEGGLPRTAAGSMVWVLEH